MASKTRKSGNARARTGNGGETHQNAGGPEQWLTTNQGAAISDNQNSLKSGERGPSLLEDFILREKITHFDHEPIPERIVHARGSIFFDAVALVVLAKAAELLAREAAAIDWVRDAFGHLKVIGTVEAAGPILAKAAVEEDDGIVDLAGRGGIKAFIDAAKRQRVWAREPALRSPG